MLDERIARFEPLFAADTWTDEERATLAPFFTNLDQPAYALLVPFPELVGALCSRASRAAQDLRVVFLREFLQPFLAPERDEAETDASWAEKQRYAQGLEEFVALLQRHSFEELFANPKARAFYIKWLAQYGDDSIAQMTGAHVVYSGISQVAIKHLEDQRIGLAPIEKSTRYVDYSVQINGQYRYYTDPSLQGLGLHVQYREGMDGLFRTYTDLLPRMQAWLTQRYPDEKPSVIRAKSYDVLRGLLPMSTLSQVAFFGSGQALEYMVSRCGAHPLGEIRWAGWAAYQELSRVMPSLLRRVTEEIGQSYQQFLAERKQRMGAVARELLPAPIVTHASAASVRLVEYDPDGEAKVIAGLLYDAPGVHRTWESILDDVRRMSQEQRRRVLAEHFRGRSARWQKVGRALENTFVRFEIVMNNGAYRDLHRHRMMTQQRQLFSCHHGYDVPQELRDANLSEPFQSALDVAGELYEALAARDPLLAQYVPSLAHRVRFQQYQNLRAFFWEAELRTIPEGHPNYRVIEQEKFQRIREVFPAIAEFMLVNMNQYDFARRGQDERIAKKEEELRAQL